MSPVLLYNPQCSKSRQAKEILEKNFSAFQTRHYINDPLSSTELLSLLDDLGSDFAIENLVRTKDDKFITAPFDLKSKTVVIEQLTKKPELLERPVFWIPQLKAVIARPPEAILAFIENLKK